MSFEGRQCKKNGKVSGGCEVETGKKMRGHEDRRESFPYFTDKALNIQKKNKKKKTILKHYNKIATLTVHEFFINAKN